MFRLPLNFEHFEQKCEVPDRMKTTHKCVKNNNLISYVNESEVNKNVLLNVVSDSDIFSSKNNTNIDE